MRKRRYAAAIALIENTLNGTHPADDIRFSLRELLGATEAYVGQDEKAAEILAALSGERPESAEIHFTPGIDIRAS